jgi:tripartite-type tricarboxylate transporter receptor subunit TctC
MGAIATHAINPALYSNFPYDPIRDFRHVALIVQVPNVLVVNDDLPVKSVKELIELAKAKPGKLDFASGSSGSTNIPRCRNPA